MQLSMQEALVQHCIPQLYSVWEKKEDQKYKIILGYKANMRPGCLSNKQNTRRLLKTDNDANQCQEW